MRDGPFHIFISHPSDYPTDCVPHGDGLLAYELIRRLAERGHRLSVAYKDANLQGPIPANVFLYPVVCRIPSVAVQPLEYMARVRSIFRRVHGSHPVDVIHQLNPVFGGLSALLTGHGVPLVLGHFVADWPVPPGALPRRPLKGRLAGLATPLVRRASRFQQDRAAALLLSSEAARLHLHDPEKSRPRSVLLPYAVDVEHFRPDGPTADLPRARAQRVLYLGSFHERKGIFPLAEAFNRLRRTRPDTELVLAGRGPEAGAVREKLRGGIADGSVRVVDGVARAEVPALIRSADLVVVPSLGEPFGMVALETFACGKGLVATNAGGLASLVDERGGRLVPPGDAAALADAMADLLGQPARLAAMGRFNRQLAVEKYAWPRIIEQVETIYRVAREKGAVPPDVLGVHAAPPAR